MEKLDKKTNPNKEEQAMKTKSSKSKKLSKELIIPGAVAVGLTGGIVALALVVSVAVPSSTANNCREQISDGQYLEAKSNLYNNPNAKDHDKLLALCDAGIAFAADDYESGINAIISLDSYVDVVYDFNGGSASVDSERITSLPITTKPIKSGCQFSGYKITDYSIDTTNYTALVNLQAQYDTVSYKITYYTDGGLNNQNNPLSYTVFDNEMTLYPAHSKTGYAFSHWKNKSGTTITRIKKGSTGDIDLYAEWTPNSYNVRVSSANENQGLVNSSGGSFRYGTTNVFSARPNRGYRFDYWLNKNANVRIPSSTIEVFTIDEDQEFVAHFATNVYNISYITNGANSFGDNPKTYTVEDHILLNPPSSKSGYDFIGWKNLATGDFVTEISTGTMGDLTLVAQWKTTSYSIIYHLNDGTNHEDNPDSYAADNVVTFNEPHKLGSEFEGWFLDEEYKERIYSTYGLTGSIDVYAKWKERHYQITYHLNGGVNNSDNPSYFTYSNLVTFANPTKAGYSFAGWCDDSGLEIISTEGYTNSINVYALWEVHNYNITYEMNGGVNHGDNPDGYTIENVVTFNEPHKLGYQFIGWYLDAEMTQPIVSTACCVGNLTIYAKWKANDYSIAYVLNGGTNHEDNPDSYTIENVVTFNEPHKLGYQFIGWFLEDHTPITSTEGLTRDIIITAEYEIVEYSITYHLDGGTNDVSNPDKYNIVSPVTFYDASKYGVNFSGWYLEDTFETKITNTLDCEGDLDLYARYYTTGTISYVTNGGSSVFTPSSYRTDNPVALPTATKTGYNLDGWYLEDTFETKLETTPTESLGNITLYAKWTAQSFNVNFITKPTVTITFDTNGGTETMDDITLNYGDELSYPDIIPTKPGYLFAGWYDNEDCTGSLYDFTSDIEDDLSLYAKWNSVPDTYTLLTQKENEINIVGGGTTQYFAFCPIKSETLNITVGKNAYIKLSTMSSGTYNSMSCSVIAGQVYYLNLQSYNNYSTSSYIGSTYLNLNWHNPNDGGSNIKESVTDTLEIQYGSSYSALIGDTFDDGLEFVGYYDTTGVKYTDKHGDSLFGWDKTEDTSLIATYQNKQYNISYVLNGGTNSSSNPSKHEYRTKTQLYPASKGGCFFGGWYLEDTFETEVTYIAENVKEDVTLYAKWNTSGYYVDTAYSSYGFTLNSSSNPNPSLYDGCYVSNNYNVSNSYAVAKITFVGYSSFSIYIRSYGESSCDYTIASNLDASSYPTSSSSCKASTSSNQQSGTSISSYTKVTYSGLSSGTHFIYVVYRKDGSVNSGTDRGYFFIDKNNPLY